MHNQLLNNRVLRHLMLAFAVCGSAIAQTRGTIRVEPHVYSGARGNEPQQQLNIGGELNLHSKQFANYQWNILLRGEFETLGRKDNSVDVDRAWIETLSNRAQYSLIVGRIHPLFVANHFEFKRPWGLIAQSYSQNQGLLLGQGNGDGAFGQPSIPGWIGAHLWSDKTYRNDFQWGVSVSPIFAPSMGPAVDFSDNTTGRFGRRPPTVLNVRGRKFPIYYEIDTSEITKEIIQPQVQGTSYWKLHNDAVVSESWLTLKRAPSIEPDLNAEGVLDVTGESPVVRAKIKPKFTQQWSASYSQRLSKKSAPENSPAFITSVEVKENGAAGVEVGADTPYYQFSYLHERTLPKPAGAFSYKLPQYKHHLIQTEARLPVGSFVPYAGVKYHLIDKDSWLSTGVRSKFSDDLDFDLGMNLFNGNESSYYGEWRTNDRFYFGLNWRLDS